ncbi:MAG: hypothetical protein EOO40_08520, partial [Deltaproteobacteria bacterium]
MEMTQQLTAALHEECYFAADTLIAQGALVDARSVSQQILLDSHELRDYLICYAKDRRDEKLLVALYARVATNSDACR